MGGSAPGKTRTCNILLRRQVLYPLSYGGRLRNDGACRESLISEPAAGGLPADVCPFHGPRGEEEGVERYGAWEAAAG